MNQVLFKQVLLEITDPELHILDEFEDVEYERSSVEVSLLVFPFTHLHSIILITHRFHLQLYRLSAY